MIGEKVNLRNFKGYVEITDKINIMYEGHLQDVYMGRYYDSDKSADKMGVFLATEIIGMANNVREVKNKRIKTPIDTTNEMELVKMFFTIGTDYFTTTDVTNALSETGHDVSMKKTGQALKNIFGNKKTWRVNGKQFFGYHLKFAIPS